MTPKFFRYYNSSSTKNNFPMAHNSLRIGKYSLNSMSWHLPVKRHSRTLCSSGSFSEALSISRVVKATGVDSWATHFTYSSFEFDVGCNRRDEESAMFLGPGISRVCGQSSAQIQLHINEHKISHTPTQWLTPLSRFLRSGVSYRTNCGLHS